MDAAPSPDPTAANAAQVIYSPPFFPIQTSSASSSSIRVWALLSPPLGTPAPGPQDGGSNSLTRAVLSLSLSEAGRTTAKARSSAPRAAISSDNQATDKEDPRSPPPTTTTAATKPDTSMQSPDEDSRGVQGILTIGVADEHVGDVISRAGRTIKEIKQVSGAWITISPEGEFMPGTCDREVFITGTSEAIRAAEAMIMRRVSVASGNGDDELTWRRVEGLCVVCS
ncbi:hypothetical protein D1007_43921 [Hordeum vulgare]|nr:hypothetical protein D1007_43921 [Hordeum vulgare]